MSYDKRSDRAFLLPWEQSPWQLHSFPNDGTTESTPNKVVLYDNNGKPLMKKRPRFGFAPPENK